MSTICVVTGAGRGLGRLIAERFARRHAVLCTDVDGAAAEQTAAIIGNGAWAIAQDVRDRASHERVAAAARARGEVVVWVNNAGVLAIGNAWEQDEATVRRMVDINLLGVIWGSQVAVGALRERGGVIINISSISALAPAPGFAVYGATKHAVLGFTTSLQGDLDRAGVAVRCAAICPDAMETDMVKNVAHQDAADPLFAAGGRMLRAEDVADEVVALADKPRLLTVMPKGRGALVNLLRAFPALQLRGFDRLAAMGRKKRLTRSGTSR